MFVDSDWAGLTDIGPDMRKSTSGCLIFIDGVLVVFYSRTQKQTAMSSCEAEYISLAAGTSEAIRHLALEVALRAAAAGGQAV